jgi:hypothetical protein
MHANDGLYAYGLVGEVPQPLDIVGIDQQHKVYPVIGQGLSVIVSVVDIDQFQHQVKSLLAALSRATGRTELEAGAILQAHEAVMEALLQHTTIVPLQFGTIFKDEAAAIRMLQEHEAEFKRLLATLSGKVECGVKVYLDKQVLMKHLAQIDPQFSRSEEQRRKVSRGAAYLLARKIEEKLKDQATTQMAQISAKIFQELSKEAVEAKQNTILPQRLTGKKEEMILNAAYLVEREKVAHFEQQTKKCLEQYADIGLTLEIYNPRPPYSFSSNVNTDQQ